VPILLLNRSKRLLQRGSAGRGQVAGEGEASPEALPSPLSLVIVHLSHPSPQRGGIRRPGGKRSSRPQIRTSLMRMICISSSPRSL